MLPRKFLKILLLAAVFVSACRFWQSDSGAVPTPTPISIEEIRSQIPFNTKEPETFQAEIVVAANGIENKTFTARNGANRLTIYDYQTPNELALLQIGGANYLTNRNRKIYTENQSTDSGESADFFPVAELLNQKESAVFEAIADENDSATYRITLDASKNSEIVVTVDKKINLPVRQEFFSVSGERKTLSATTELRNFSLQTDAQSFELPSDYRRVSPTEFQESVRRERQKPEKN